ncbi:MAG: hypothetical protein QF713_04270 [Dehalococcoidales bacterium]|nr:hypothetical protein [Dehalococcoidales bacterium]MDP7525533.1 hypothetical protein [Dehalococcoidales bacterium]
MDSMKMSASGKASTAGRQPTKKGRSLSRKRQKDKDSRRRHRRKQLGKLLWIAISVSIIGGMIGGSLLLAAQPP